MKCEKICFTGYRLPMFCCTSLYSRLYICCSTFLILNFCSFCVTFSQTF